MESISMSERWRGCSEVDDAAADAARDYMPDLLSRAEVNSERWRPAADAPPAPPIPDPWGEAPPSTLVRRNTND
ncbi:MAG: hypothetical protein QM658_17790 [Gordonia sp. (in: high G+C Gram-positive bacteria)]